MYSGNKILKETRFFLIPKDTNMLVSICDKHDTKEVEMKMPIDHIIERNEYLYVFNSFDDDCFENCDETSIEICEKCSEKMYREFYFFDYLGNNIIVDLKDIYQTSFNEKSFEKFIRNDEINRNNNKNQVTTIF